jgi:Na+/melibiose symporter-like transporter
MWLIYVVAALGALLGNTFQIGSITALANLVDKDQLTEANGRLQATYSISFLVGPLLAGLVSGAFGPATAIGIDAVSFLVSALSLMFIRFRLMQRPTPEEGEHESTVQELLAGVKFLWRQPVLRWLTILLFLMGFLAFAGLDLFIFHLKHNLGQSDNAVGVVFGLASVGGLAGSLMASRLRRRWGYGICWLGGCLVQGISLAVMGVEPTLVVIAVMAIVMQAAGSVYGIMSMSFRQETTPDHLLGRVTAAFWTLSTISGPLGAAVMTSLAEHTSVPFTILLMGAGGIACAAIGIFTPIRTQMVGETAR